MIFNPMNKGKRSGWIFQIHNDIKDVEFYLQKLSFPGVEVGETIVNSQSLQFKDPSNDLTFPPYELNIMSDEGFEIYTMLFNMIAKRTARAEEEYADLFYPKFEGIIYLLSNKGTPIKKLVFHDSWIQKVTPYELDVDDNENQKFIANVNYTYSEILDV